jgi:hypothetical protein
MMMAFHFDRFCLALIVASLAGCAQFPDVDRAEASRNPAAVRSAAPSLLPVDALLDESRFSRPRAQSAGDSLQSRAAALQARAAALRRAKPGE